MKHIWTKALAIAEIVVPERLRPISEAHVETQAASMATLGLQQPLVVGLIGDDIRLVAGAHRLAAARSLGWLAIECRCMLPETDDPESEFRLAEIDENLIRHGLNPLDRAIFMAERKRIHEALYPDTTRGGDRRSKAAKNQNAKIALWSFSKDTAKKTGLSKRTIERAGQVFAGLSPDIRAAIRGTKIAAKEGELFRLAKRGQQAQRAIVSAILSGRARTVEQAERVLAGTPEPDPTESQFARLVHTWSKASPEAQRLFIDHLKGTGAID